MNRKRVALALTLSLALAGCERSTKGELAVRPNVVLITIDTLRADHLGSYGNGRVSTPNLDWVAAQGVVFERAHCDVTWTTPSMTSTMLGQFATRHGLRTTFQTLDDEAITLAEMLKGSGYATAAIIGSYPLSKIYNLDQGFDSYDDAFSRPLVASDGAAPAVAKERNVPTDPTRAEIEEGNNFAFLVSGRRTDEEVSDRAIEEVGRLSAEAQPFFLWVHYFGPHLIPDGRLNLFEDHAAHIRTYAARTSATDREVGRLLSAINRAGIERNTLLLVHADHGESLGEHDYVGHGRYLYDDNLRVPMLMRWPDRVSPGTRSSGLVGNVDIAPTILDATGTKPADRPFDGRSLLPLIEQGQPIHDSLVLETYCPTLHGFAEVVTPPDGEPVEVGAARFGLLRGEQKFIRTEHRPMVNGLGGPPPADLAETVNRRELYDLAADPGEREDQVSRQEGRAADLERELDQFHATQAGESAESLEPDPDHSEKLRALGYVQ